MVVVKMKGQTFLLMSVVVMISLLLLRNSMTPFIASSDDSLQRRFFDLRNEMINVVDLSIANHESIGSNLDDFVWFSESFMKSIGYNETSEYTVAANGSDVSVAFNLTLSSGDSYMHDSFIVNRRVFA